MFSEKSAKRICITAFIALLSGASSAAMADRSDPAEFLDMSLEMLSEVEVTSVSKKSEKASNAAAAIHVITKEDIDRSGMTSVPELLRMVPGLQVARAGAGNWAISSRGFNDQFSNKLLVLVDGRSVYTPSFSGVYWDIQNIALSTINRIEVIRGPGATLWGANAVNGVINIITDHTKDTVGTRLTGFAGDRERGFEATETVDLKENGGLRVHAKQHLYDESESYRSSTADDAWRISRFGFRYDVAPSEESDVTVNGEVFDGNQDYRFNVPTLSAPFTQVRNGETGLNGGFLQGNWQYQASDRSRYNLQGYVDYANRKNDILDESIYTTDIDFQHLLSIGDDHEFIWGLGYRNIHFELGGSFLVEYRPSSRTDHWFSAFAQDQISLTDALTLTVGSKFEHNDYTGFEWQPSARMAWVIDDKQTWWTSVSRAVRIPNRTSDDLFIALQAVPTQLGVGLGSRVGNRDTESENLIAYETGYRVAPVENLFFDIALFYNEYTSLFTDQRGTPFVDPRRSSLIIPVNPVNAGSGQNFGAELASQWRVTPDWSLKASYTFLKMDLEGSSASVTAEGKSPQQQFNMSSYYNVTENVKWDTSAYYVDELSPAAGLNIEDYLRLDTRLAWQVTDGMELSLAGQNLLDKKHLEFSPFIYGAPTQVGRSVYAKVAWQF